MRREYDLYDVFSEYIEGSTDVYDEVRDRFIVTLLFKPNTPKKALEAYAEYEKIVNDPYYEPIR